MPTLPEFISPGAALAVGSRPFAPVDPGELVPVPTPFGVQMVPRYIAERFTKPPQIAPMSPGHPTPASLAAGVRAPDPFGAPPMTRQSALQRLALGSRGAMPLGAPVGGVIGDVGPGVTAADNQDSGGVVDTVGSGLGAIASMVGG